MTIWNITQSSPSAILIVDDNPQNLHVLAKILQENNFEIEFATNGEAAMVWIKEKKFDLILLDINMPGMDGFEVCRKIRSNPVMNNVPVIFLSADTDRESIFKGFELGAQDYVTKPFDSRELLARVRTHLALKDSFEKLEKFNKSLEEKVAERTQQLIKAKEKAEESDRLKTAFLQNMSHEIRTPLNAILGFSELLQDPKISQEDSRFFLEQIHFSKDDLLDLIENVVFAAKYDTKQFVSTTKEFNLNNYLNELISDSKKLIHRNDKSHIDFLSHLESTKDITIEADENNIKMALRQLISNAIKYTDSGQIEFGTKLIDNSVIEFYIRDTGVGIDKNEYEKIFDKFYKVESNSNKLFRGAGIGLTIVKGIAETLGGNVRVDSIVGQGTTFYFSIPVVVIGIESKKQQPQNDISNIISKWGERNILIAEDVDTNFKYLDKILDFSNITRFHAKNGQEAVGIMKTNKIDLVLMDILMPVMDGYEAATIIRTIFPSIPIIAQTGIYNKTNRDADLSSLFNDYLIKPINRNSLVELLDKFLQLQN